MLISQILILASVFLYSFVHSLLASIGTKAVVRRWFGSAADRWYRLAYNLVGLITFLPILSLVVLLPDQQLYSIPAPWVYLTVTGQIAAVVALGVGILQTGVWSFLGLQQALGNNENNPQRLVTTGFYRWVRHPLYTAGLVFIWLTPVMTDNLLALNLGLTIYLVVGALHEERKLVRVFGDEYVRYQQRTPMLFPNLHSK